MITAVARALVASLVLVSFISNASLLINGSFEDNDVADGKWSSFKSSKVNGWQGTNIEIWDSLGKYTSYDGEQLMELNSTGKPAEFSIYQTFETTVGYTYEVSFAYAARKNLNEAFMVEIYDGTNFNDDNLILQTLIDDSEINSWSVFAEQFSTLSDTTTIMFTSMNSGTVGNLLDDISVETMAISEPQAIPLIGLGLLGLLALRRRQPK